MRVGTCEKLQRIEIKDKLNLTVNEAAEYSNIGENALREMLKVKDCPFLLRVGKKYLIKRKEFESYLDSKHFL